MAKLIGRKLKMTQIFENDAVVPVSLIALEEKEGLADLKPGLTVKIRGISKGKGFQGVVKRHNFHGGPRSHGQKDRRRAPGSIGATTPQKVIKGHKMAGRMGGRRLMIKGLKVVKMDAEKNQLLIKGALPGNTGGKVEIIYENNGLQSQ